MSEPVKLISEPNYPLHRTIIEPPQGWQLLDLKELWRYRELLWTMMTRDVKVRYKQTILGAAWAIIQPAMMMIVFTIFFGRLAKLSTGDLPQPLFFLSGLIPWTFFAVGINATSNSVLGAERIITKIYFPRLIVPFAAIGGATVDFLVAFSLLMVMTLGYWILPSAQIFLAPIMIGIIMLLILGLGTFLSAICVTYRDFRYLVPFFIQIGMYATPTIYLQPKGDEGELIKLLLTINPMTSLIAGFRASIFGGPIPWLGVGIAFALAIFFFALGCLYFRKVEDRFADII
jgi:lipopolysaccharide transport system permease protein